MGVADRPGAGRAQGFTGFRPIGNGRIEGKDTQRFPVPAFMAHVGFGKIAEPAESFLIDPRRKQLVPAVEIPDFNGRGIVEALEYTFTNESVWLAGAQSPTEAQAEVVVDLLEDHARSVNVFVKMTVNTINAATQTMRRCQTLPISNRRRAFNSHDGD